MGFAALGEPEVEGVERRVPAEGGGEGGGVERAPESFAPAGDVGLAGPAAALLDERGEAGEGCGLLAADVPEFGHAHDQGEAGPRADPGHAQHQLETLGEVGMLPHVLEQALELVGAARLQLLDVGLDEAAQAVVVGVLQPGLPADDVRLELLDIGQPPGELVQARVGLARLRLEEVGAGRDHGRVDAVALGPTEVQPGKGADLRRLEHQDGEALVLQVPGDAALVAAGGLDADAADTGLRQVGGELSPAGLGVVDLEEVLLSVHGDVERVLAGVDPGGRRGILEHLRLTLPCEPNLMFEQPSGSDEDADAIVLQKSHEGSGRVDPTPAARRPGWPPWAARSSRNEPQYPMLLLQGRVEAAADGARR